MLLNYLRTKEREEVKIYDMKRNSEINKFTVHFPSGLITLGLQRSILVEIFLCKLPIVWIKRTHDIKMFLILAVSRLQ
jgi:hypothetical protein